MKVNIAKTKKVTVVGQHPNRREYKMLKVTCIWDNTTTSRKIARINIDTRENQDSLGYIRHTTGSLKKQPCHQSEETGVQLPLPCAARYDM